jgi:hypothetical protein
MNPRPLSMREHAALLWVLTSLDDREQADVLYRQSLDVVVTGGTPAMVDL